MTVIFILVEQPALGPSPNVLCYDAPLNASHQFSAFLYSCVQRTPDSACLCGSNVQSWLNTLSLPSTRAAAIRSSGDPGRGLRYVRLPSSLLSLFCTGEDPRTSIFFSLLHVSSVGRGPKNLLNTCLVCLLLFLRVRTQGPSFTVSYRLLSLGFLR
jgi:hypothetical protein